MTNIEKLESAIRQALPELMELTEGCQVSYNGKICTVTRVNIQESFRLIEINYMQFLYVPAHMPIIGHPITLLHLLRWLGEMEISCKLSPVDSINAILLFKEYTIKHCDTYHVHLELSKPLLRDQSDDVIEELNKLLK